MWDDTSWTCHICGDERPDEAISVYSTDISADYGLQPGSMGHNVRYCNDRAACILGGLSHRHDRAAHEH